MVILDRQVDMVTPLCTQLTYEGLIDELIGIKNSFVEVDPALTNPVPPTPSSSSTPQFGSLAGPPKKKKHLLSTLGTSTNPANSTPASQQASSAGDPLFGDLRDKNFTVVGGLLNRIAKRINADYEARHAAQTVSQMRDFVGKLSGLQAEHQALRLREYQERFLVVTFLFTIAHLIDTSLTEQVISTTTSDEFNRVLEIQQSKLLSCCYYLRMNGLRPAAMLQI